MTRTAITFVTVYVIDTDDHKPHFDPATDTVTVKEHALAGVTVANIRAIDEDSVRINVFLGFLISLLTSRGPVSRKICVVTVKRKCLTNITTP